MLRFLSRGRWEDTDGGFLQSQPVLRVCPVVAGIGVEPVWATAPEHDVSDPGATAWWWPGWSARSCLGSTQWKCVERFTQRGVLSVGCSPAVRCTHPEALCWPHWSAGVWEGMCMRAACYFPQILYKSDNVCAIQRLNCILFNNVRLPSLL